MEKDNQINEVIKALTDSLIHIDYLLANSSVSFIDRSSLGALRTVLVAQIDKLKRI